MPHTYEIYKDKAGEYRARFKYNSETIFSTEGFASRQSALNAIESMKKNAPSAPVYDTTDEVDHLRRRIVGASAPAANRIVEFDHNSKKYQQFKSLFDQLDQGIRTSNELGTMIAEDLQVMKSEIIQLRVQIDQEKARSAHIWTMAKSTLLWVVDNSASAVIGTLALSVLAALATLLGIDLL